MLRALSPVLLALVPAILSIGCLGTLQSNRDAEVVSDAAAGAWRLPLRETRPHWFLRQEPGWLGAHRLRFGGEGDDEGFAFVRIAVFTDAAAAGSALARITPEYMHALWHSRMDAPPRSVSFPVPIPGDQVTITEYPLRPAPADAPRDQKLIVQLIALRAGRVVLVIESIGTPREDLAPVADRLVRAARGLGVSAR